MVKILRVWIRPTTAKDVDRLRVDIVVDESSVDTKTTHEQYDIATAIKRVENLKPIFSFRLAYFILDLLSFNTLLVQDKAQCS